MQKLEGLELLVSSRFHLIAMAIVAGTPFLAVVPPEGNAATDGNKIRGLLEDIGLGHDRQVQADGLTPERVRGTQAFSESEREAIAMFLGNARLGTERLFDDLAALARAAKLGEAVK